MPVFSTLLIPILVLWISSLVLYVVDRFLDPQDRGTVEVGVLVVATALLLATHSHINHPLLLGNLGNKDIPSFLVVGKTSWLLALLLSMCMLVASLLSWGQSAAGRVGRLATLGSAWLFFFAGDWATLALAWVLVDTSLLFTLGQRQKRVEPLVWSGVLSLAGAAILGVALLLWQQADGSVWVDPSATLPIETIAASNVPPKVAGLLVLAAVLRLVPFPLPMWQTTDSRDDSEPVPATQIMAFVVPMLLTVTLWTRLAQWNVLSHSASWLSVLGIWAGIGLLINAFRSWNAHDPGSVISFVRIYGGLYLLLGASLGLPAGWQLLVGINLVLSLSVISISWQQCQYLDLRYPHSYWRAVPAGLGVLSLAGIPLLIGFPARIAIYWTIFQTHKWFLMLGLMVAEAMVVGTLMRTVLDVETMPPDISPALDQETAEEKEPLSASKKDSILTFLSTTWARWNNKLVPFFQDIVPSSLLHMLDKINWPREIAYFAASSLAIGILILGVGPGLLETGDTSQGLAYWFSMPRLPVWAALLLPIVAGIVLYRQRDVTLSLVQDWWPLVERLIAADWAVRVVEKELEQIRALIWGATQVVEGAGYMAWVLVVCLVLLLLVISRQAP